MDRRQKEDKKWDPHIEYQHRFLAAMDTVLVMIVAYDFHGPEVRASKWGNRKTKLNASVQGASNLRSREEMEPVTVPTIDRQTDSDSDSGFSLSLKGNYGRFNTDLFLEGSQKK